MIAAALDAGCRHLVLGVGGSASTDGGVGMVQAFGARVTNAAGHDVGPGGLGAAAAAPARPHRAASRPGPRDGRGRLRRRQPADRSPRRRRDLRPAEGCRPRPGAAARRGAWAAGPTSSPRRPARTVATNPAPERRAASASLRPRCSARSCDRVSRWCSTSLVLPTQSPAPTSSSPERARSTSRRCAARRRPGSRLRPAAQCPSWPSRAGARWTSRACGGPDSTPSTPWSTRRTTRTSPSPHAGPLLRADRRPAGRTSRRSGRMTRGSAVPGAAGHRRRRRDLGRRRCRGRPDRRSSPRSSADRGRRE